MSNPKSQTTATDHFTQDQAQQMWRALAEIAFAEFDAGATPDHIRSYAKQVVKNVS